MPLAPDHFKFQGVHPIALKRQRQIHLHTERGIRLCQTAVDAPVRSHVGGTRPVVIVAEIVHGVYHIHAGRRCHAQRVAAFDAGGIGGCIVCGIRTVCGRIPRRTFREDRSERRIKMLTVISVAEHQILRHRGVPAVKRGNGFPGFFHAVCHKRIQACRLRRR